MLGTWAAGAAGDEAIAPAGGFNRPRTSQDPGAAEAEKTPTSYVDRPLTLPGGHLALGSSFGWLHADLPASTFLGTPASSLDALAVSLGARYGITDGLELDLLLPGLALAIQPARPAAEIWSRINEPNLIENVLPTRDRASLVLTKAANHAVTQIRLRKV